MVFQISRITMLVAVALAYSGGVVLLMAISPHLLYAIGAVVGVGVVICLLLDRRWTSNLTSLRPYLFWLCFFFLCGTLASLDRSLVLPRVISLLARNALMFGIFALAVTDRQTMTWLSYLIQAVAILNFGVALSELLDPQIALTITYAISSSATGFSVNRPAGLWLNPNEAAFAFLFSLFLSHWGKGILIWAGRVSAVGGILLTASRSGLYILIACGLIYAAWKLKPWRVASQTVPLLLGAVAFTAWLGLITFSNLDSLKARASGNFILGRVLDASESASRDVGQITRSDLTLEALSADLRGPWFGYGVFTFQGFDDPSIESPLALGAHNIYLAVWGEAGVLGILSYLLVLSIGIMALFNPAIRADDRIVMSLMWLCYLIVGLVWHDQLASLQAMIMIAMLYQFPGVILAESKRAKATLGLGLQVS